MGLTVVLTGASGFVGGHLLPLLRAHPSIDRVVPWSRRKRPGHRPIDLRDAGETARALADDAPDVVVHLAALAGAHGHDPALLEDVNVAGLEGILEGLGGARLVAASTGYVYGPTPRPAQEAAALAPVGPYAGSKLRMERRLRGALPEGQLRILRPFNHSGPGQPPGYALPDLADKLLARVPGVPIATGSLRAVRDMGDVRDLAGVLLAAATRPRWPLLCNVCTGRGRPLQELFDRMAMLLGQPLPVPTLSPEAPPALPRSVGDPGRLRGLGIQPQYTLDDTLQAVLRDARERLRQRRS
jgi:GDP-4-dehydro-6-deoxy-D-mannose reductase